MRRCGRLDGQGWRPGRGETAKRAPQAVAPHPGQTSRLSVQSRPQLPPRAQVSHLGLLCSVIASSPQRSYQVPLPVRRRRSPSPSMRRNEPRNSTTVLTPMTIQPGDAGGSMSRQEGCGVSCLPTHRVAGDCHPRLGYRRGPTGSGPAVLDLPGDPRRSHVKRVAATGTDPGRCGVPRPGKWQTGLRPAGTHPGQSRRLRITRAGFPTAMTSGGRSLVTTLPAPTVVRSPMVTPGNTIVPPPSHASSPMVIGLPSSRA